MSSFDQTQPHGFSGDSEAPTFYRSPILGMATPLQRERSHSEKIGTRSFAPSSLDVGVNYYTRVFEANAPETVVVVDPSLNHMHSTRIFPASPKMSSHPHEKEPLISDMKSKQSDMRQRTVLLVVISLLVLLLMSAIVIYFVCLNTPQIELVSFTRANLFSTKGNILDTKFSMQIENTNVQALHIKAVDVNVCFRSKEPGDESLCIGLLHDHDKFSASGRAQTPFNIDGQFNISTIATKYRIINTLRTGDFDTDMTGYVHYSTLGLLDMKHHIDTTTYVRNPLLD